MLSDGMASPCSSPRGRVLPVRTLPRTLSAPSLAVFPGGLGPRGPSPPPVPKETRARPSGRPTHGCSRHRLRQHDPTERNIRNAIDYQSNTSVAERFVTTSQFDVEPKCLGPSASEPCAAFLPPVRAAQLVCKQVPSPVLSAPHSYRTATRRPLKSARNTPV